MKNTILAVCSIVLVVGVGGCSSVFTSEPEATIRELVAATNDLADVLQSVRDADSARAAIDTMDRKFTLLCNLMGKMPS